MNHNHELEDLSALMDGELQHDQTRFMLRRLQSDSGLRTTWSRFHVIADGIRGDTPPLANAGFAERVMQQLHDEAGKTNSVSQGRRPPRLLRWSAGGAIAAGVAVAALVMTQPTGDDGVHATRPSEQVATRASAGHRDRNTTSSLAATSRSQGAPVAPRWLQASPSIGQMTQPAAADFSFSGGWMHARGAGPYQARERVPYAKLPRVQYGQRSGDARAHGWWVPRAQSTNARPPSVLQVNKTP